MSRSGIMLCYPYEEKRLNKWKGTPYIQPKLDGERCRAILSSEGVTLLSSECRQHLHLPHITEALSKLDLYAELDGELYTHGMALNEIHSICTTTRIDRHPEYARIEYHIFDIINDLPWKDRAIQVNSIGERIKRLGIYEELKAVPSARVYSMNEIEAYLNEYIEEGYEGFILRNEYGLYERKRSTNIMKFKPRFEDIYEITGYQEEISISGTPKNSLGAFICRSDDSAIFSVGSGPLLTREARQTLWQERETLPGQYLKVMYQTLTPEKRIPRHCIALQVLDLKPHM